MQPAPENKLAQPLQTPFALAVSAAKNILKRRTRVLYLVRDAYAKLGGEQDALARVREDLRLLLRLAHSWATRQYRDVPWKSLLYTVAAVLYFVNPVDLFPDVLAGIGFIDDIAVISAVVGSIRRDLDAFREWDEQRKLAE